ncbi:MULTISPECIES: ATP-binding protein [unclassified Mesorhizobium]|uniref:ATP-binding protein n=1 Tax=unclassified Mesorhizobium TaxID=325217 RepID=UPI000FDBE1F6|nr:MULTISPECIES: ATP-binding protein [unclassified Mesorhizobium]TGR39959.1 ATP-binding protein [bacterium M00.F.Ca.ET.199.01.1.1]TGU24164.1 ATP-binding protein [bacterium M00.F.Ca.ET.156.01.1.1]TGV89378.1 ATP-binding protein [Mesorhizobium sp. M00.F.Ca.ET.149.01.1.1]TGR23336.1 ATP-binding protein [Mesorhizobium sp. M8A.F.Ca.ET.202.01.1.1]TGR24569.1 ATP-binding protein [Mesorhizobium sp. M8A.F.Ca.ET.197.01.1.1]
MGVRNAPPHAGSMLESLRGLGYVPATALADLVDNSVTANASEVGIHLEWRGADSWVRIVDDGDGMDDSALEAGMRLGARDPRGDRATSDLGRFGLGLKTASFSQARRLTVASRRKGGSIVCLRWDLDLMGQEHGAEWPLFEGPAPGSEHLLEPLDRMEHGTVVLWETLDRIVTHGFTANDMIELADRVEAHLAMTFHRLIDGPQPEFKLLLNGRVVKPWDPFLMGHPGKALESLDYRLLHTTGVTVQCHVLPHRDMLKPAEQEAAAGPNGWTQQEGFYVYRNRRLLLAGGWLGLGDGGKPWPRDEAHRLARIRLDIPNSADAEWKINVLKSMASPPVRLRYQLHRLASETRDTAKRVFAHRGHVTSASSGRSNALAEAWQVRRSTQGTSYRIARDHDLVASILDRAGPLKADILALLRLIEETVPVQRIWLDTAEDKETPRTCFAGAPEHEVQGTLSSMFEALVRYRGQSPDEARERLGRTPPFDRYLELVAALEMKDSE